MGSLHPLAHRKSHTTYTAVCSMNEINFRNSEPNVVTFYSAGVETLRISDKGFWVHGEKVDQDDKEAQTVYNSFKEWLTWQQLNRG